MGGQFCRRRFRLVIRSSGDFRFGNLFLGYFLLGYLFLGNVITHNLLLGSYRFLLGIDCRRRFFSSGFLGHGIDALAWMVLAGLHCQGLSLLIVRGLQTALIA
jgi:hypothetical protein